MASRTLPNPILTLVERRSLIKTMVRRDLAARYRGSAGGALWAVLQPMAMLGLYTFVFSAILKVKFGVDGSTVAFAFYLFSGMIPWLAFSEALGRSPNAMLENANLVKKVVFPLEILPVNLVVTGLMSGLVSTAVLAVGLLLWRHALPWTIVLLPLLWVLQYLFTQGLAWMLASVGVFMRDVGHMIGLLLTAWMFLTPIMYPASAVPEGFRWVLWANPMAALVEGYRAIMLEGVLPDAAGIGAFAAVAAVVFALGYMAFMRTKHAFADVL
ncbi:Teichoic acid translocation permease protein TagG [compost metagenome]